MSDILRQNTAFLSNFLGFYITMSDMNLTTDQQNILCVVYEGKGQRWTNEVARVSGLETADANGGNQNWYVYDILCSFEHQGLVTSAKQGEHRSAKRLWTCTNKGIQALSKIAA